MPRSTSRAALAALALLLAPAARADSACMADAVKLCPDVPFGDGRVVACLTDRWSQLSGACIQDLQRLQAKSREITLQCSADVWTHCNGVAPGAGRVRTCLLEHFDLLGAQCRTELARLEEKAQKVWDACQGDASRLCTGMTTGGGQVYACLKAQESKVSPACRHELR